MKINGNPEGGQGGGLTPQQEALINSVPNKVNQVRLVTDGSAIRHEGALTPLTFSQIYDLVMDNSKYVYIVMDNNIRFRPSAYDGDAIWFDSSFIEEGKPNILRCIINSDNRVDITQIVVASEEYVDEKVAEAGGLTPEQKEAVDTLVTPNIGMLYTNGFTPFNFNKTSSYVTAYGSYVDGELYINLPERSRLCKFENGELKDVCVTSNITYGALWKDKSGRYYLGEYSIDLTTGQMEPVVSGMYTYNDYATNTIIGNNAVYNCHDNVISVFNEETLMFEEVYTLSFYGLDLITQKRFDYNGRILSIHYGMMYEFIEEEGNVRWEELATTPFDYLSCPGSNDFGWVYYNGTIYHANEGYEGVYKNEGDSEWSQHYFKDQSEYIQQGYWFIKDGVIMKLDWSGIIMVNISDSDIIYTPGWVDINKMAVDLSSTQSIAGMKMFENIQVGNNISINCSINFPQTVVVPMIDTVVSGGGNIDVKVPIALYGNEPAIKDDLYINSQVTYPGRKMADVSDAYFNNDYPEYYIITASGRIFFYNNNDSFWYEFKNGAFEVASILFDFSYPCGNNIVVVGDKTYCIYNQSVFLFNEELTRFEFLCDWGNSNAQGMWSDGSNLRYSNYLKLDQVDGVWGFVSDQIEGDAINGFTTSFTKDGEHYIMSDYWVYKYDAETRSLQQFGYTGIGYAFNKLVEYHGEIYFGDSSGEIYRFNPNRPVDVRDLLNIRTQSSHAPIMVYNDMIVSVNYYGHMYRMYNITYIKPEVPESDGTYVLKATRVGDQITYTWVTE